MTTKPIASKLARELDQALDNAEERRDLAKLRLQHSLGTVRYRFSPKTLVHDALTETRERAVHSAEVAIDAVKARPALVGSVAAGLAFLLLRKPVKAAMRRLNKEK